MGFSESAYAGYMPSSQYVLIVEDDPGIGANLRRALATDSIAVQWAATCADALKFAHEQTIDLALIDLGLPDGDGINLCQQLLRRQPALPIIIVTARDTELDVIVGLDSGAVDYVTKPFRLAELHARVRAHLRRVAVDDSQLSVGSLRIECAARVVTVGDRVVELRAKEFDLLTCLAAAAGTVLRREDLMTEVWDEHWFGSTKTLDVTVASLRKKLDDVVAGAVAITTVRGVGYRLERS